MQTSNEHVIQARALQADILAAPGVWLPRREILLEWLSAFLNRAVAPKYVCDGSEVADLEALNQFLRKRKVPVAA